MTRIFYDTEFLDQGSVVHLISIGAVTDETPPREFYAINKDAPWEIIIRHNWLLENVMPHLDFNPYIVKDPIDIDIALRKFITETHKPELWAWYSAYDHVLLCQIFGGMLNAPESMPKWTNDLRQVYHALKLDLKRHDNNKHLPEHHALNDARHLKDRFLQLSLEYHAIDLTTQSILE